jgi:hypothetical protein
MGDDLGKELVGRREAMLLLVPWLGEGNEVGTPKPALLPRPPALNKSPIHALADHSLPTMSSIAPRPPNQIPANTTGTFHFGTRLGLVFVTEVAFLSFFAAFGLLCYIGVRLPQSRLDTRVTFSIVQDMGKTLEAHSWKGETNLCLAQSHPYLPHFFACGGYVPGNGSACCYLA